MGFTPLEGLVMSTRCGSIDPALVTYLMKHDESLQTPAAMDEIMYHKSGFLGLSGGESHDMKTLEQSKASTDALAALAIESFMHVLVKQVSSYVGVLRGVDTLCFGGGIGEHAHIVRRELISTLASFLPIELDVAKNAHAKGTVRISTDASKIEVWVVAVDEGAIMVRDALKLTQPEGLQSQL